MAITYPTTLDALVNPTATDFLNGAGVQHWEQHANANDAIEALEAKVGVTNSAVTTSLDYKVTNLISGKLASTGSAPTIAAGAAAGTGPTVSVTGNDKAGTVSVTTGTSTTTGVLATITFNTAYAAAPKAVTLEPKTSAAAANVLQRYTTATTSTFVINANVAPTASVAHAYFYSVTA